MNVMAWALPRRRQRPVTPEQALAAAAAWLARAQDATGCGGVSAYYDAAKQAWVGAYPETTGYVIPTLLRYALVSDDETYRARALRMAAWESDIQLADGGVRAGTLDAREVVPTIFNTGQVLFGWLAAWQATGDTRFRDSLIRAADWLVTAQDADGAWRRFASPFAKPSVNAYNTRVAFALAEVGHALEERRYLDAAVRNADWALTRMQANGWLADNDLQDNARPLTHTIAYATRGLLEVGRIAAEPRFTNAAERVARAVVQTQRRDGALPGRLDRNWSPAARWTCVTGNVQMAIIWQLLGRQTGDTVWQAAADRAIDFTLGIQNMTARDPAVRGGLPGSHPRRGGYMRHRYPNWAAKFFMDALMLRTATGRDSA